MLMLMLRGSVGRGSPSPASLPSTRQEGQELSHSPTTRDKQILRFVPLSDVCLNLLCLILSFLGHDSRAKEMLNLTGIVPGKVKVSFKKKNKSALFCALGLGEAESHCAEDGKASGAQRLQTERYWTISRSGSENSCISERKISDARHQRRG